MEVYGRLYLIRNRINGKLYIGQTTQGILKRFEAHCWACNIRKSMLSRAIHKYGRENFEVVELSSHYSKETLDQAEELAIKEYDTIFPKGYNLLQGGNSGGKHSEETRRKISMSLKGIPSPKPDSFRLAKIGVPLPEAHRKSISEGLKGRTFTEEHRQKIREHRVGSKHTPEAIQKMRDVKKGKPNTHLRCSLTLEDRDKILELLDQQVPYKKIAEMFGLKSTKVIRQIKSGVHWLCHTTIQAT